MKVLQLEGAPKSSAKLRVRMALRELLIDKREHRRERRIPYISAVSVTPLGFPDEQISAFVRDVSPSGVGLVHLKPLVIKRAILTLPLPRDRTITMVTQIVWCREFADGWFASGGKFEDVMEWHAVEPRLF